MLRLKTKRDKGDKTKPVFFQTKVNWCANIQLSWDYS